jgi:hypothetical protein
MQFDKSQILDLLRSQGDDGKAQQADEQLPQQVTPSSTPGCWKGSASARRS